jgi:hypothetical protein
VPSATASPQRGVEGGMFCALSDERTASCGPAVGRKLAVEAFGKASL